MKPVRVRWSGFWSRYWVPSDGGSRQRRVLGRLWQDESGAGMTEYLIITGFAAFLAIASFHEFGKSLNEELHTEADRVQGRGFPSAADLLEDLVDPSMGAPCTPLPDCLVPEVPGLGGVGAPGFRATPNSATPNSGGSQPPGGQPAPAPAALAPGSSPPQAGDDSGTTPDAPLPNTPSAVGVPAAPEPEDLAGN